MDLKARSIIIDPKDPFKEDTLDRQQDVENFKHLLKNLTSPTVVSINAPWGYGKTTFLKMLASTLNSEKFDTVFYSAWETDFASDPLLAFLGEINKQVNSINGGDATTQKAWSKTKSIGNKLLKRSLPVALKLVTMGIVDSEEIKSLISDSAEEVGDDLVNHYLIDKNLMEEFKISLEEFLKDKNGKARQLYIFVDELDRCRPTYAIELLERIKHLLEVPGLNFILAMDEEQLAHSIKAVYGSNFDSKSYLNRFIDFKLNLPAVNISEFILNTLQKLSIESFKSNDEYEHIRLDAEEMNKEFRSHLEYLYTRLKLSLRDLEQIISEINLIIRFENFRDLNFRIVVLLLTVKRIDKGIYLDFISDTGSSENLIQLLYSRIPEIDRNKCNFFMNIELNILKFKFSQSDEKGKLITKSLHRIEDNQSSSNISEQHYSIDIYNAFRNNNAEFGFNIIPSRHTGSVDKTLKKIELTDKFSFK